MRDQHIFLYLLAVCLISSIHCEAFPITKVLEEWDPYQLVSYAKSTGKDIHFIDPNGFVEDENDVTIILEKLKSLRNIGVDAVLVVVNQFHPDYGLNRSGMKFFVKEFQYYLMKEYPEFTEDNILIICYSIEDERSFFKRGEKVKEELSEDETDKIQVRQISKIRDEKYAQSFIKILDDTIYFMDHCDDCVTFWVGIGFFIFAGTAIVILLIIQLIICIKGRQISEEEKQKVHLMSAFLSNYSNNPSVLDEVCIFCLYSLNPKVPESNRSQLDESNAFGLNSVKKNQCGHSYHTKCFEDWTLLEDDICPHCIEKLDKEDSVEKVTKKLIDIQSKLHKVFNELTFRFENNKLKYKFSNDFHQGDLTQLN